MHIRIGTRTSLMAMAQAKTVAALLAAQNPGLTHEFVGIVPAGDKDKKTPLWQMGTVGVFSKEIDDQLLSGHVDITVHSFKDLGTQRPDGISMGALLPRENPRDILLLHPDIERKLREGQDIFIGTSAPRRTELLPDFLARALPRLGDDAPRIHVVPLRGNANTRIGKLKNPASDDTPLDAIVLALAGLGRLFKDDAAHDELQRLLDGLRYMVLPLTVCPSAPGQGTICVETLDARDDMKKLLAGINHQPTADALAIERSILVAHGGGCHQKFGATCLRLPNLETPVVIVAGKTKDGRDITEIQWQAPANDAPRTLYSPRSDDLFTRTPSEATLPPMKACFVAHSHALPASIKPGAQPRLWVSGTDSWYKMAARGLWVEGCADGFGFDFAQSTMAEPFLALPAFDDWFVVTSDSATVTWKDSPIPPRNVIATYKQQAQVSDAIIDKVRAANAIWWPSMLAFDALSSYVSPNTVHCCGTGKTATSLRAEGISPMVFPNFDACQTWAAGTASKKNGTHA